MLLTDDGTLANALINGSDDDHSSSSTTAASPTAKRVRKCYLVEVQTPYVSEGALEQMRLPFPIDDGLRQTRPADEVDRCRLSPVCVFRASYFLVIGTSWAGCASRIAAVRLGESIHRLAFHMHGCAMCSRWH